MSSLYKDIFSQFGPNSGYVEELFDLYLSDPSLVGDTWARFFDQLSDGLDQVPSNGLSARGRLPAPAEGGAVVSADHAAIQERIYRMVSAFRGRGHLRANINPLTRGVLQLPEVEDVDLNFYQFGQEHLEQTFFCAGFGGKDAMRLKDLIDELQQAYCGSIGFEFTHLFTQEERLWLQDKIERRFQTGYRLTHGQRLRALHKIIEAEAFESELHKKYIGHKRFSLQGGEALIPMIDTLLEHAAESGVAQVVVGMAHRGRLNVLANTLGKPLEEIFSEFEDQNIHTALGSGDVKYHMGFESRHAAPNGNTLELLLAPNPSHLEFVDPVVEGIARALQDLKHNGDRRSVLPVLLHGDAAFVGQGVVPETVNLSRVEGYTTGGTIHIVINNQIGFTTNPDSSRSTVYCSDMANAPEVPVFHVNGDDIDAVCWAVRTALEFRNRYQRDVIIDMYCYRRYGHNEGDDPSFTQPITYSEIKDKETVASIYANQLKSEGAVSQQDIDSFINEFRDRFEDAHARSGSASVGEACAMHGRLRVPNPDTGVDRNVLNRIAQTLTSYPEDFTVHPKLHRILEKRVETVEKGSGIDWGGAEALAFGSVLLDGCGVRLSGQDSGRGTFSQRHLEIKDYKSGRPYFPLSKLTDDSNTAVFEVFNSTLSEAAVLGFEFGYATEATNTLVLWEAQFGDFANGAQVIIDQFISSSEAKWNQLSGVVMLLPHGYEGQGPEHSSARLERYLQLCAEGNMVVAYPSNAAQYFHLLRRQALLSIKRPLIVMTPKSLLRFAGAACEIDDLTRGQFQTILVEDIGEGEPEHLVLLTGKIYYDLQKAIRALDNPRVRLVRIEQLYPFPQYSFKHAVKGLDLKTVSWVQEEPANMGAWNFVKEYLRRKIGLDVEYIGRPAGASTAAGSSKRHAAEQKRIVDETLSVLAGGDYTSTFVSW